LDDNKGDLSIENIAENGDFTQNQHFMLRLKTSLE